MNAETVEALCGGLTGLRAAWVEMWAERDNAIARGEDHGPITLGDARPDWVVVGVLTGERRIAGLMSEVYNRYVRDLVEECRAACIPVWVKQVYDGRGRVVDALADMPEWARVREVPV